MSAATELVHPETGRTVHVLSRAKLHQTCRVCGEDLFGCSVSTVQGARIGGGEIGWFHLAHLKVVLMAAPPTRARSREMAEAAT